MGHLPLLFFNIFNLLIEKLSSYLRKKVKLNNLDGRGQPKPRKGLRLQSRSSVG